MRSNSREANLLKAATALVERVVGEHPPLRQQEVRFQLLEAVASRLGGFDLSQYQQRFGVTALVEVERLCMQARTIVAEIRASGIPPALAVSALAREALDAASQKRAGVYHTDFRLAQHLASTTAQGLKPTAKVIDPACGAGILLAAVALEVCGADRQFANEWLARNVFAADLSANALRGTLIALSCLSDDVDTLVRMRANWRIQDSLLAGPESWAKVVKGGFDLVIANPPWEKIKISRHEFIQAEGGQRHYGAAYDAFDADKYETRKTEAESHGVQLAARYSCLGSGEPDLYVAFAELLLNLAKPGGSVGLLLPAGLIRSQSTRLLREHLYKNASTLSFQIFENRARFFEIDTRFKFLLVSATKRSGTARQGPIELSHAYGTAMGVEVRPPVRIGRAALTKLRPDLSIPEVKSEAEWKLFVRMAEIGCDWSRSDSNWHPEFMREVDMTRDRHLFLSKGRGSHLPVVEGRMVHQHRFGAKGHVGGTGRSAVWAVNVPGASTIAPQFWIDPQTLPSKARERTRQARAGYCDITGQTNERSCLAAMIPPDVVCGNKVPTITFPNDPSEARLWLWIALANSFPFDWMIRRIITTTINYFHLLSLPLPPLEPNSLPGQQIIAAARQLSELDTENSAPDAHWQIAELRAKIDHLVLSSYRLVDADLDLIIRDFPLIDGAQPPIEGEARSTITRDLIHSHSRQPATSSAARQRVNAAAKLGALPYMPSQMASALSEVSGEGAQHG